MSDFSREALLQFVDYLADKGLLNKATAQARKVAVNNMLGFLDEAEAADVRALDMDDISTRFANISGGRYNPSSLRVYKSRVSSAVEDFVRYRADPTNFRMLSPKKSATPKPSVQKAPPRDKPTVSSNVKPGASVETRHGAPGVASGRFETETVNMPVAIRPGVVVWINGLPTNLSESEARRISNVLLALGTEIGPPPQGTDR